MKLTAIGLTVAMLAATSAASAEAPNQSPAPAATNARGASMNVGGRTFSFQSSKYVDQNGAKVQTRTVQVTPKFDAPSGAQIGRGFSSQSTKTSDRSGMVSKTHEVNYGSAGANGASSLNMQKVSTTKNGEKVYDGRSLDYTANKTSPKTGNQDYRQYHSSSWSSNEGTTAQGHDRTFQTAHVNPTTGDTKTFTSASSSQRTVKVAPDVYHPDQGWFTTSHTREITLQKTDGATGNAETHGYLNSHSYGRSQGVWSSQRDFRAAATQTAGKTGATTNRGAWYQRTRNGENVDKNLQVGTFPSQTEPQK